jgi:MSHA biogenesis protein MshP
MRSELKRIRGFALVSAIFILVVLAALGAFIVNISTSQQIGSALDVQGVRAYQAARAGIEWGLYQVQSYGAPPAAASPTAYNFSYGNPATTVGAANPNLRSCASASGSFDVFGFSVTVICTQTYDLSPRQTLLDGTPSPASCNPTGPNYYPDRCGPTVYALTSTACLPAGGTCPNATPGNLYIERRLTVAF